MSVNSKKSNIPKSIEREPSDDVVEQVLPDAGTQEKATFNLEDFFGYEWGSRQPANEDLVGKDTGVYTVSNLPNLFVISGPTGDPDSPYRLMSLGFDEDRLSYGSVIFFTPNDKELDALCMRVLQSNIIMYGEPHATQGGAILIWQNYSTTMMMMCTDYGPILDLYFTLWLQHNQSFIAHDAIPLEEINEFKPRATVP